LPARDRPRSKTMRKPYIWLIRCVTTAVCYVAAASSAFAKEHTETQVANLVIQLTPKKNAENQSTGLRVSYTLVQAPENAVVPLTLRLDTLEPALTRTSDQVADLHASDARGAVEFSEPVRQQSNGKTFQVWKASRPTYGVLHVSYVVPVALPHPPIRGPHIDLQAAGGGVSGALVSVLLLPPLSGHIRAALKWHMSKDERAVSTFAYGNSSVTTTMDELNSTLFLAGRLETFPSKPPTKGFSMYSLGCAPGALRRSASWYEKAYEAMRQAFHPRSDSAFRVLIRSYDGGPLDSGRANNGSLLLYLPLNVDPGSPAEHSLIAHEMVHVFTRPLDGDSNGEGDWYTEGIADYLKITVPFAAGLYSRAEYLGLINSQAAFYYTNPDRDLSVPDAAKAKWKGNVSWTIPYARGSMYFANLDAELRAKGQSVIGLINEMNHKMADGEPSNDQTWLRLLETRLGQQAVAEWTDMWRGHLMRPVTGAFGGSLETQPVNTGYFSLGYLPAYHTEGSVIQKVLPGTNAASAGLIAGDSLAETVDINPLAHSFASQIRLRIERHGKLLVVTFDPHTKEQVPAWEWRNAKDDQRIH